MADTGKKTNATSDVLNSYINDMIGVETHILEALTRQHNDDDMKKYGEAHALVGRAKSTLESHIEALRQHVQEDESFLKKAVTAVTGTLAGLYDSVRGETASRNLRDDYTALSLSSASYSMLMTTALCSEKEDVAATCERHLRDNAKLLMDLSGSICTVVGRELADDGQVPNASGAHEAVRRVHEAWSSDAPSTQTSPPSTTV